MIVVRDPKESLDKWYQSEHRDNRSHLEETMKIFGVTEADLPVADDELEFEQVVKFKADYLLVVEAGGTKGDMSSRGDAQSDLHVDHASLD